MDRLDMVPEMVQVLELHGLALRAGGILLARHAVQHAPALPGDYRRSGYF